MVTGNSSSKPDRTGRDGKFVKQSKMLNNSAYSRLGNNFDCLTNFPSLPVRSGFDELFPVTTFLTVVQSHDTLISMFLYIT